MFVFKHLTICLQFHPRMQKIKYFTLRDRGDHLHFLDYDVENKRKYKTRRKISKKDGFGDMHSQPSLYSFNEEISLCLKTTKGKP